MINIQRITAVRNIFLLLLLSVVFILPDDASGQIVSMTYEECKQREYGPWDRWDTPVLFNTETCTYTAVGPPARAITPWHNCPWPVVLWRLSTHMGWHVRDNCVYQNDGQGFWDIGLLGREIADHKDNDGDGQIDNNAVEPAPAKSCVVPVSDPVDPVSGMYFYEETDMGYPAPSLVAITRKYNSYKADIGPFGKGTNMGYNHRLIPTGGDLMYITPDYNAHTLYSQPDGTYTTTEHPFLAQAKGYWTTDPDKKLVFGDGSTLYFDRNSNLIGMETPPATGWTSAATLTAP
jgi:hypothetical protein